MNKTMIKYLKEMMITTCCSFTIIVMGNALLSQEDFTMTIGVIEIQQTFMICFVTSLMIHLILRIRFSKEWMNVLCSYIAMHFSVFGLGTCVFQLIPWSISVYLSVSIMCAAAYLFCMSVILMIQKDDADKINSKLNARSKRKKEY